MIPMEKKITLFCCLVRISNMFWNVPQSLGHERNYTENSGISGERELLWLDKF